MHASYIAVAIAQDYNQLETPVGIILSCRDYPNAARMCPRGDPLSTPTLHPHPDLNSERLRKVRARSYQLEVRTAHHFLAFIIQVSAVAARSARRPLLKLSLRLYLCALSSAMCSLTVKARHSAVCHGLLCDMLEPLARILTVNY